MSIEAAIIGSSLISGAFGGLASSKASKASKAATAESARQFDITQENFRPYREAGTAALSEYQRRLEQPVNSFLFSPQDLENEPGYQFRFNQGIEALNRGAAKQGNIYSGNRALALTEYGQGFGANEYQNAFNRALTTNRENYGREQRRTDRYGNLIDVGRGATGATAAAGNAYTNALFANAGNQADAAYNRYGAFNDAVQGGLQNWMTYNAGLDYLDYYPQGDAMYPAVEYYGRRAR